jgi:hypothetical protein
MKKCLAAALVCLLVSCESNSYAPMVTLRMANARAAPYVRHAANPSNRRIEVEILQEGRSLFVSRCIECHTLPIIWYYRPSDWLGIIDEMAERSSLKPAERDAVVAYILAVRAQ